MGLNGQIHFEWFFLLAEVKLQMKSMYLLPGLYVRLLSLEKKFILYVKVKLVLVFARLKGHPIFIEIIPKRSAIYK
jgi:hypothetical protein